MATAGTTGASSARSIYGCWTCRIRKKKCDENRPACHTCVSLELKCNGYGDKPVWMDNGPLQREQALRVKRIVSYTKSKRRKSRILGPGSPSLDLSLVTDIADGEMSGASDASFNYPAEESPANMNGWSMEILEDESNFYPWNNNLSFFRLDVSGTSSQDDLPAMESIFNNRGWENNMRVDNDLCGGHDSMLSGASGASWASEVTSTPTANASSLQRGNEQSAYETSQEGMNVAPNNVPVAEWSWSHHLIPTQSVRANRVKEYSEFSACLAESILPGEMEDKLFIHYLDEIFYIQYPFGHKQYRAWLFSILRRVRPVYHATLALSERHMQSMAENNLVSTLPYKPDYHGLALREMEINTGEASWSGTAGQDRAVEDITCILQLIFCELFAGGTKNWRPLLLKAANLILPLVQARMTPIRQGLTGPDLVVQPRRERDLPFGDNIGTKVLLGSFISFDIIACASTRSLPSLKLDHKRILETFGIDLGSLFGCTTRVATLILEIVRLDDWKTEAEKSRKLSMAELVRRGAKIEELLQQQIADLRSSSRKKSSNTLSASQTEITNIFALSALTYLHVVVSGAQPEMLEIKDSVSRTLFAFQSLTDPRLLRNLAWPFCVSGCLALEKQQTSFRELVSKAEIAPSTFGTCPQAIGIVEELLVGILVRA